jgi:hypothetical protein
VPQEIVLAQDELLVVSWSCQGDGRDVHCKEMLRVLERAAQDSDFVAQLTHRGQEALQSYDLSWKERAALLSGDVRWIEARLGRLDARLRTWLDCRLEQEKW